MLVGTGVTVFKMVNLFSIVLLLILICRLIFADSANITSQQVARGDQVILTCNISETTITQIIWASVKYHYSHSFRDGRTFSNFSKNSFFINHESPSSLKILGFQDSDTGLYRCDLTGRKGLKTLQWNLTLIEPKISSLMFSYLRYILTPLGGLLLIVTSAACLYRIWSRSTRQSQGQTPDLEHTVVPSEGEDTPPHDGADDRRNRSLDYEERLNSIYSQSK